METSCYTHRLRRMLSATCVFGLVLLLSAVGGPVSFAQSETATVQTQTASPPENSKSRADEAVGQGEGNEPPKSRAGEVDTPATPKKPDPLPVPEEDERGASAEAPKPPTPPGQEKDKTNSGVGPDGTPPGHGGTPPGLDEDRERGRSGEAPGQVGENLNNRGSIKIQEVNAAGVSEQPHPGCSFQLAFFGFDAKTLDVNYTLQAPTGAGTGLPLGPGTMEITSSADRGNDRVGVVTYGESQVRNALAAAFGSDWASQAHPQQGFHVKVTVRDPRLPAAGKHKVFWLDCPVGETSAGGDETTGGVVGGDETTGGVVGGDETTGGVVGGDETTGGVVGGDETTGGVSGDDQVAGGVEAGGEQGVEEVRGEVLGEERRREGAAADHVHEHDHDHVHVVEHDNLPAHEHPHAEAHGHAHEHADHGQVAAAGQVTGISVPNRVDAGGGGMAGGDSSLPMAPILATAVWVLGLGYLRRTPKVVATP